MLAGMKPWTPKDLLRRLVTRRGNGSLRHLRKDVTAAEVQAAVGVVRHWLPEYDLRVSIKCRNACRAALGQALGDRQPHPDEDWDLVEVYAGLVGVSRAEACELLHLPPSPEPEPDDDYIGDLGDESDPNPGEPG
jgi:hypothetical protein